MRILIFTLLAIASYICFTWVPAIGLTMLMLSDLPPKYEQYRETLELIFALGYNCIITGFLYMLRVYRDVAKEEWSSDRSARALKR